MKNIMIAIISEKILIASFLGNSATGKSMSSDESEDNPDIFEVEKVTGKRVVGVRCLSHLNRSLCF